jgi:hypothetical protein
MHSTTRGWLLLITMFGRCDEHFQVGFTDVCIWQDVQLRLVQTVVRGNLVRWMRKGGGYVMQHPSRGQ